MFADHRPDGGLLCALALSLGWSRRIALALALMFGLATPAWAYTVTFFSEPTIGLCLVGAVVALLWNVEPTLKTTVHRGCWLGAATLTHLGDTVFYALVPLAFILLYIPVDGPAAPAGGALACHWRGAALHRLVRPGAFRQPACGPATASWAITTI